MNLGLAATLVAVAVAARHDKLTVSPLIPPPSAVTTSKEVEPVSRVKDRLEPTQRVRGTPDRFLW
jgi:hypothetical protein